MRNDAYKLKKNRASGSEKAFSVFLHVFLSVVALLVLYPIIYVICAAFSPGDSISSLPIIPFSTGVTFEHFSFLFSDTNYLIWFKNTFIISASTSLCTLVVCSLGAYAFSRFKFTGRNPLLLSFLILQVFPSFVGMIAIYVILWRFGGLDTLWGMVLVYTAGNIPYNTWLVKNYMDALPKSLDEAARIDGASSSKVFRKIIFPLTRPILTFLAITSFAGPWMDYIFPKMILRSSDKQTLALGLYSFVTDKKADYTTFAAGAVLVAIPFIVFFMLGQKMMVQSLASAAVKE